MKLSEIAAALGAELIGQGDIEIRGASGIGEAGDGHITFVADEMHLRDLERSRASAAIVPLGAPAQHLPVLRVKNPRLAFARMLDLLYKKPYAPAGISEKAVIGSDVTMGRDISIHPYVVVADGAKIGDRVILYPGVYVGDGSMIGDDCVVYPNVSIREGVVIGSRVIIHAGTVIGSDGFGFVTDNGRHHKIPQVGGVIIEDDVEIGANCAIDRAALGNTLIKQGTKIDNLVHIAHNVTIGEHCLIAGQVGIAGSATIGNYVVFGGQVGVGDHVTISEGVMASAQAGIIKDPGPRQIVGGTYAMPHRDWLKVQAVLPKLPELKRQVAELERQVKELKQKGEKS
jgi:UDP-3-O-[3-hydroxymyristoyl] glucosamine N-acyltransferase